MPLAIFQKSSLIVMVFLFSVNGMTVAQTPIPFESDRWEISSQAHLVMEYQGKEALYLHNGTAVLKKPSFKNGIIEFNIAFTRERGFTGITWRRTDAENYEDFYIRPHMSGNPDANQYTPVFNGVTGWQLYHGDGYGSPLAYPFTRWIHVKVVVWEGQAQIFIDDMREPAVKIPELKHKPASGGMGLRAFLTPVYFSDFSWQTIEKAPFDRMSPIETKTPEGMVMDWEVSSPFEVSRLQPAVRLEEDSFADLDWHHLQSEVTGITNLARLNGIENERNTVFARMSIHSDREQVKKLQFGYSDRVRVYVNGEAVYGGDNTYTSRDYRYLGTIGLFDELYLPLKKGSNEVWFAVTEAFGGWGIMAKIEDRSGIQINSR